MYKGNPLQDATIPGVACIQTTPQWGVQLLADLQDGKIGSPLVRAAFGTSDLNQTQSEDCLRLDIVVPNRPKSQKLPVVVMIHGGGEHFPMSLYQSLRLF